MTISITTPHMIEATRAGTDVEPAIRMQFMLRHQDDAYDTLSINVEHPFTPITPTLMRRLGLRAVKSTLVRQELAATNPELMKIAPIAAFLKGNNGRPVAAKDRLNPTHNRLDEAFVVLRLARLAGEFSVISIERCFGIERNDARRWVKLARRREEELSVIRI